VQVRRSLVALDVYVENLLSHSSVIRATDHRGETVATARHWLMNELAAFFPGGSAEIEYQDWLHVLQRRDGA
jgi:hypothetical protein